MDRTVTSFVWQLHAGDYVVATTHGEFYKVLFRTPNDLELQALLKRLPPDQVVVVFRVAGTVP